MSRDLESPRMNNIDCLHGVFGFHNKSIASRQILTRTIIIYKWGRKHTRNVYLACPLADQVNIDFCGCECRKYLVLNLICVSWLLSFWLLQLLQTRLTCSADHIAHPLANNRDNIHVFQYCNLFLTMSYNRSAVESRKRTILTDPNFCKSRTSLLPMTKSFDAWIARLTFRSLVVTKSGTRPFRSSCEKTEAKKLCDLVVRLHATLMRVRPSLLVIAVGRRLLWDCPWYPLESIKMTPVGRSCTVSFTWRSVSG